MLPQIWCMSRYGLFVSWIEISHCPRILCPSVVWSTRYKASQLYYLRDDFHYLALLALSCRNHSWTFVNRPFNTISSKQISILICLDSNRGPLVLEATALPAEPQPSCCMWVYLVTMVSIPTQNSLFSLFPFWLDDLDKFFRNENS